MASEMIYQPAFVWDQIPGEERRYYLGFMILMIVAYKTTFSERILLADEQLAEVIAADFGPKVANDFGGHKLPPLVAILMAWDLVRSIPDDTLSAGRYLKLFVNPFTGDKGWIPAHVKSILDSALPQESHCV